MRALLLVVALAVAGAVGAAPAPTKRDSEGLKPKLKELVDKLGQIKAPAPVMHEKLAHAKFTKPT
jgi:hypothetical protein